MPIAPVPEVHVFEFFRDVGVALSAVAPACALLYFVLRTYVTGEINKMKGLILREMDATTMEIRNEYVTIAEFGRQLSAHEGRFDAIATQLTEIRSILLNLVSSVNGNGKGRT